MEKRDSGDRGGEGCQGRRRKRQQVARRQAEGRGRVGERRRKSNGSKGSKGATDTGRIDRPKHRTTRERQCTMRRQGAREQRDNRSTSRRAAAARGVDATLSVARNRPTKSTVVKPHSNSLSCVPITYITPRAHRLMHVRCSIGASTARVPRTKERANSVP